MSHVDKLFVATKAFIEHQGKVLVVRESKTYKDGTNIGKFDVVGGRMEPGQRFDESLIREVKEETGLDIEIGAPFFVNEWRPNKNGENWQIVGIFFHCKAHTSGVSLSDDHDAYKWIDPKKYKTEDLIDNLYSSFEAYLSQK